MERVAQSAGDIAGGGTGGIEARVRAPEAGVAWVVAFRAEMDWP